MTKAKAADPKKIVRADSLQALQAHYAALNGGWSQDTIFMAKSSLYIAEQVTATRIATEALCTALEEATRTKSRAASIRRQLRRASKVA